ncbi:hypothetical protein [Brachybacterium sp. AOP3-A1-3]|uniref:hypothetical protein n=1 Tax=Brachybacterium sp. AOP3-A1-3 TaxID=3457699 RepID=UPI004033EBFF
MSNGNRNYPKQAAQKLGQADRVLAYGADVAAACRELNVIARSYYQRRNQYGGTSTLACDLVTKIRDFITGWNHRKLPFVWTKTPEKFNTKFNCNETLTASHWEPLGSAPQRDLDQ